VSTSGLRGFSGACHGVSAADPARRELRRPRLFPSHLAAIDMRDRRRF